MSDTIASNAELARKGVNRFFPIFSRNQPRIYTQLGWRDEVTTEEFFKAFQESGFGYMTPVSEATPIPTDSFETLNEKDFYWVKRGSGWKASFEKVDTDQYGISKKVAKKLARAMEQTKDSTAASVFNNMTSAAAAFKGPDGKALVATDHPTKGGEYSNRGTGPTNADVDLAVGTLALAIQKNMDIVNHRNIPDARVGPWILHVPTALTDLANRLMSSKLRPQTGDNDDNWAGGLVTKVVPNPWLTDPDAWTLVSANQDEHGLFMLRHGGERAAKEIFESTQQVAFYLTAKWLFSFFDARGVWGSPGV